MGRRIFRNPANKREPTVDALFCPPLLSPQLVLSLSESGVLNDKSLPAKQAGSGGLPKGNERQPNGRD